MDLEPEEVEEEWYDDEPDDAGTQMLAELRQRKRPLAAIDIEQIP